jgi:putative DNA primase/helicase
MSSNYDDVFSQLSNFGLVVGRLEIGRMVRCRVTDDKEKRGWYIIHEVTLSGGDKALVGSYGIWHGAEANAQKIELSKIELTGEQKAAIRERIAEDRKRATNEQKRRAEKAALQADKAWRIFTDSGDCDYLQRKGIAAHGIRFTSKGAIAIPMLDTSGRIHGLQFILDKTTQKEQIEKHGGRDKQFWPSGCAKKEHFHLIGSPTNLLLIAEGYATAASLHEATGFATAIAFDANNLTSVAKALKKRYPVNILICADDDAFAWCTNCSKPVNINLSNICPECKEPHKKRNAGADQAELAALAVGGRIIAPRFADQAARFDYYCRNQGKLTDYNDLHTTEGLHTVRLQVESALLQFGWTGAPKTRVITPQGGGADDKLQPIDTTDELLERFSLVYGKKGTVFDHKEHQLLALSDMRDACMSREIHRRWQESPQRSIVRVENVGFDPGLQDPQVNCNLWAGWPTTPKAGICDKLVGLLEHMCSGEDNAMDTAKWVVKWLAYPIQNPGAKMRTALVIHGPQGTGKNLFFEVVMAIYGRYGRIIDQPAIDDKHNDWASAKLFMIADEVVARSDLYHIKNKLKCFITGEWIRINPKNVTAYEERNHVNLVFLSNERMPVVIEEDDRRHCVIWTPAKKEPDYYKAISEEIKNGGIAALHDWFLNINLGDFDEHAKPPSTQAKDDLLALSKDNVLRFYEDWINGEFNSMRLVNDDGLPNKDFIFIDSSKIPVLSDDLFEVYKIWCNRQGVRPSPRNKVIDHIAKRPGVIKERSEYELNKQMSTSARSFIYPPKYIEKPEGIVKRKWLGHRIIDFQTIINQYKTINYD